MSKSLERVRAALATLGLAAEIRQMPGETRTAADAAREAGCTIDQIAKSIIFRGATSGAVYLFLTAGGNRVDPGRAAALVAEPLARADADLVRARTGFAVGGVAPLGHRQPIPVFVDPRLLDFPLVWAAAGTPRHILAVAPAALMRAIGAVAADFAVRPEGDGPAAAEHPPAGPM